MIGIIGQGFVGKAIYEKFKDYYKVETFDLNDELCNSYEESTYKQEFVFVCLPTPMNGDGSCNTSIVESAIEKAIDYGVAKTVIIKSTITPGTTEILNAKYNIDIVFNPEFLTERNAISDYKNQTRIILGGDSKSTSRVKTLFLKVFPGSHIIKTDSTSAEMVKYVTNTFLAMKVSFANEIFGLCTEMSIDYDNVIEYASLDERLGKSHWNVPGHDGDYGYGGHCFPKDLAALIHLSEKLNTINNVLHATQDTNDEVRSNRDWEQMKGRAIS
jgi:nucleotide sugar dehydrogenase